jgi:hypothetical protein
MNGLSPVGPRVGLGLGTGLGTWLGAGLGAWLGTGLGAWLGEGLGVGEASIKSGTVCSELIEFALALTAFTSYGVSHEESTPIQPMTKTADDQVERD